MAYVYICFGKEGNYNNILSLNLLNKKLNMYNLLIRIWPVKNEYQYSKNEYIKGK